MRLNRTIAIAVGAAAIAGGSVAGALTTPEQAEGGLTEAEERSGRELPSASDEAVGPQELEAPATDELLQEDAEVQGQGVEGKDNHGAEVVAVAQGTPPGPEHGVAVSAVASDGRARATRAARRAERPGRGSPPPQTGSGRVL
jgi:hypothetical protein